MYIKRSADPFWALALHAPACMRIHEQLKKRTKEFARDIARFVKPLYRPPETADAARQLRRASSGMASNYRAAGLARSDAEFLAKMGVVREEADESCYWLEDLKETQGLHRHDLMLEAAELRNIFNASYATAHDNFHKRGPRRRRPKRPRRADAC
jgi:four helix bundle protein